MMLTFVVDAREDDVVGVTRLLHVALTGFLGGFWDSTCTEEVLLAKTQKKYCNLLQSFAKLAGER